MKWILVAGLGVAVALYFALDVGRFLSMAYVQSQLTTLQAFASDQPGTAAALYLSVYILFTALSVPGSLILTLLGGAIFGLVWGTVLVSFASSIGATLAFLTSRWLLRDWVQSRFGDYLAPLNRGMERDGIFYLFSIRMVPVFPFFAINLLMGLTPIRVRDYYLVSQAGMFLATIVFVNAGVELGQLDSLAGLVSPSLLLSFALLGILPLITRFLVDALRGRRLPKPYPKPDRFDANVVVIGAGSAGLVASLIVAGAGARVVLVERHRMGGDCLNTGCVPSKTFIRSARAVQEARGAGRFGFRVGEPDVDFPAVMARVEAVIRRIEPHDSVERFTSLGVECVSGEARLISPYLVQVGDRVIRTRSVILATGARPALPPIPGLAEMDPLTSDTVWSLRAAPPHLLVLGGGPIGCELAQAFAALGSRVTLMDAADRLLPREDAEVAAQIEARFAAEGIRVLTGSQVQSFTLRDGRRTVHAERGGEKIEFEFDAVLVAVGRKANVEGFGLEDLGIRLTPQGTVEVNESLQTNYPNIFACGDVAGPYQFTHMAAYQAWFAALNALVGGLRKSRVNYRCVPWTTFTSPEVARVGLNEGEARQKGIRYEVTRFDLDDLDRAMADGEDHGFIKVLTEPGRDRILGVTIVGAHAGELIGEFVFAMTHGMGLKKIAAVTHIYPTFGEANKFVANAWRKARMPTRYLPWAERFFRWQRGE